MYIGILKIDFVESKESTLSADLKNLCIKIGSRYKVLAKPSATSAEASIIVLYLHKLENSINHLFDKILEFCEFSGIGRVGGESAFIDTVECLIPE